jgi:excisionase family DNA binding protein
MEERFEPKLIALSIKQFGNLVGIKRTKCYELINAGRITKCKIGRRTLITMESVEAFLAASVVSGGEV